MSLVLFALRDLFFPHIYLFLLTYFLSSDRFALFSALFFSSMKWCMRRSFEVMNYNDIIIKIDKLAMPSFSSSSSL